VIPEHRYSKLKHVKIIAFSAVKSVVELTCQILESATSLKRLTLDITNGMPRCSENETGKCIFMIGDALIKAYKGVQSWLPKLASSPRFPPQLSSMFWRPVASAMLLVVLSAGMKQLEEKKAKGPYWSK
jgi:hypothetical protein